ncbi:MAG TPA: hypothetical protein VFK05_18810 [Polyangiaceae bacterium]|nr:hypothetical protein [Polyangiaceae bacterium]
MTRAAPLTRRLVRVWLVSAALAACGSNTPKIPPELLANGSGNTPDSGPGPSASSGCNSPDYPSGPFGTEEGDTLADACFRGFRKPDQVGHSESSLETIAFSDYYDPTGSKGYKLILINTAAVWCSACRSEHEGLPEKNRQYGPRGLVILSTLFQDAHRDPATLRDLDVWVDTFSSDYAMVLDPEYQLGGFARADTAPLNLVIDARTMKIEKKLLGDQASILWPFIDASLAQQ